MNHVYFPVLQRKTHYLVFKQQMAGILRYNMEGQIASIGKGDPEPWNTQVSQLPLSTPNIPISNIRVFFIANHCPNYCIKTLTNLGSFYIVIMQYDQLNLSLIFNLV